MTGRRYPLLIVLLGWLACGLIACGGRSPASPTAVVGTPFVLGVGEGRVLPDGARVTFVGVENDSRCPADAVCITGGDAIVRTRIVTGGTTRDAELHTGDERRASVTVGAYRLALTAVEPYPFSSRTIDPREYRVTLVISAR